MNPIRTPPFALLTFAAFLAAHAHGSPTANEDFVIECMGEAYTNAVTDAAKYTDTAVKGATPGDYAAVSNKAYSAATKDALDAEAAARQAGDAAITNALADYALKTDLSSLAPLASLESHIADTDNPHAVTAAQIGALTAEADPLFAAWTNGNYITLGQYNEAKGDYCAYAIGQGNKANGQNTIAFGLVNETSGDYASGVVGHNNKAIGDVAYAFGYGNRALGDFTLALGYKAYASAEWSLAVSQTPDLIYLGSSTTNNGASARTLQSYLDERATTNDVAALSAALDEKADSSALDALSPRYTFAAPATSDIAAADAFLYTVTADADGVSVTLPATSTDYSQDFVLRLSPADTNGTCLAEVKSSDATAWQFDYPTGTNAVFGTITSPTYFTFTQTAADRWSVITYAATKED